MQLKLGSRGPEVIKVQQALKLTTDGAFGPKTEAAIRVWQRDNGFPVDGIITTELLDKLTNQNNNLNKLTGKIPTNVLSQLPEVIEKFSINSPLRIAHFLAQCGHESGGFRVVTENLNYSASGLMSIFKKYFPNEQIAKQYERQPEKIANFVYANRMQNGNPASGDGWRFRGRGYIQLTGRENYTSFNKFVPENILETPDLVATKYPLLSAAWFWDSRKLNATADTGDTDAVVTSITRRVNGGTIGLADRIKHFKEYYLLLK
jgi:putative chitinase